jgi:S1-C subfamily serine protease
MRELTKAASFIRAFRTGVTAVAVMVVATGGAAIGGLARDASAQTMPRATRLNVMKSVVKLRILIKRGGRWVSRGHGSGSILTADGLILTNNHVVQNTKTRQLYDAIAVAPNITFDSAPKPVCMAFPARAIRHPSLDLAIIKCEADMSGRPLKKRFKWPVVTVGDSNTLIPGDALFIVGFPGVGGATITFTSGKVSGFLSDRRVGKGRAWIKTDALISGGVSGGAAFDASGKLVGVPTAYRRGRRGHTNIGLVRAVQKARPLIAMARKRPWRKLPRVASRLPGPAQSEAPLTYRRPPPNAPALPTQPKKFGIGGMVPDQTEKARPRGKGGTVPRTRVGRVPGIGSGLSAISGRVIDASTQRPIRGAVIVVLKAGVNAFRVTQSRLRYQISTAGLSDSRGFFLSRKPIRQGGAHGIIVVARGYEPLRLNRAIKLFKGTPPEFNVGLIRMARKGSGMTMQRERLPRFQELK